MKRRLSIFHFALFGLLLSVLAPSVNSVLPPPDGGYSNRNTAEGTAALFSFDVTAGSDQTAIGYHAMHNLESALFPITVVGALSLPAPVASEQNVAVGFKTLFHEGGGTQDVAIGSNALLSDGGGYLNLAAGASTLRAVTSGFSNTSVGSGALQNGQPGNNTAIGYHAYANGTSGGNIVVGSRAFATGDGSKNVALGFGAMSQLGGSGHPANIAIGFAAGSQQGRTGGSRNIDIGSAGAPGDSKIVRIGTTGKQNSAFIAGISGVTVAGGIGVVIDTTGHLGITTSSARYKEHVKSMAEASEVIYSLQPVAFQYRPELDPSHRPQFGLIAEDVAKVAPVLVAGDKQGRPYAVHYQAINAVLLNEFQKDYRTATQEEATLKAQTNELDQLTEKVASLEREVTQQAKALTNFKSGTN
jgi:hypothetical protein